MSLTNSGLVKHSSVSHRKIRKLMCLFTGKQHQTSYRKEKTEITILSKETTNIKIKIKSKITILRKQLASEIGRAHV